MKRTTILLCASVLVPALAAAQPRTPNDWYKEGENKYNLGDFQGAVEAFKKGFELEPNQSKKAAYLFNVAQSYRMDKDCYNAQFFYKRYLALKDADTKKPLKEETRKDIEDRIRELDECARQQEAIRNKPPDKDPDTTTTGTTDTTDTTATTDTGKDVAAAGDGTGTGDGDGDTDGGGVSATTTAEQPRLLSIRAFGGGAKINSGDVDVPIRATFGLAAGYPLALSDQLILDLGAAFTFTPVPFDYMGVSGTGKLIGLVANAGATYLVTEKLGLRGDLGVGGLFFSDISQSQFTDGQETTGALSMFHLRVAASADYAVTKNVLITAIPVAFSYSPAHKGLRDDIKSITAIDFMIGIGYRM